MLNGECRMDYPKPHNKKIRYVKCHKIRLYIQFKTVSFVNFVSVHLAGLKQCGHQKVYLLSEVLVKTTEF